MFASTFEWQNNLQQPSAVNSLSIKTYLQSPLKKNVFHIFCRAPGLQKQEEILKTNRKHK